MYCLFKIFEPDILVLTQYLRDHHHTKIVMYVLS